MRSQWTRRDFMNTVPAAGIGLLGLSRWPIAFGEEQGPSLSPDAVRFRPEIEPIVRWIEETPRERITEKAVEQVKSGLSYRDMMAGIFLAAIRNIKPRPVGFKFHAVMAVHSAHLLGQAASQADRLLPLFWALD